MRTIISDSCSSDHHSNRMVICMAEGNAERKTYDRWGITYEVQTQEVIQNREELLCQNRHLTKRRKWQRTACTPIFEGKM